MAVKARLTIIEADSGGHRLWYVRLLILRWLEAGGQSPVHLITSTKVPSSLEWDVHLADLQTQLEVSTPSLLPPWRSRWLVFASGTRPHRVVIPDGDRWLPAVAGLPVPPPTSILVTRPLGVARQRNALRRTGKTSAAALAGRRRDVTLFSLDLLEAPGPGSSLPDPVEISDAPDRHTSRMTLGLSDVAAVNLLIGAIDERKGVTDVINAWKQVRNPASRLALVGHVQGALAQDLRTLSMSDDRVLLVDEYVPSSQFDRWVSAADRVLALYHNEGSSGVALKSWALGVPVVAFAGSYLQQGLSGLGARVIPVSKSDTVDELKAILAAAPEPAPASAVPRNVLLRRNRAFTDSLLGFAPGDPSRSWDTRWERPR